MPVAFGRWWRTRTRWPLCIWRGLDARLGWHAFGTWTSVSCPSLCLGNNFGLRHMFPLSMVALCFLVFIVFLLHSTTTHVTHMPGALWSFGPKPGVLHCTPSWMPSCARCSSPKFHRPRWWACSHQNFSAELNGPLGHWRCTTLLESRRPRMEQSRILLEKEGIKKT